jgi:transcriptional antiterminator NusG
MNLDQFGPCWYALQTRPKCELMAATVLKNKGYDQFLPLRNEHGSGRPNEGGRSRPLYPGYIFCRFDPELRGRIVTTSGVLRIVSFGCRPAQLSEDEIANVRRMVEAKVTIHPNPYLATGEQVRVISGPLRGLRGILLGFKGRLRVVVSIHLLQRSSAVEIDLASLEAGPVTSVFECDNPRIV